MDQAIGWQASGHYTDVRYETADGIAKITIDRPEVRNAFRPLTTKELIQAFDAARDDPSVGVIILTGQGTDAFCSGGDQKIRGDDGYVDEQGVGRLNVLDLQIQIRRCPKPVVAMVAGYAIGGGHVLHLCCDLTIAAENARFGQTGPRVGSFDAGYGINLLARQIGEKRAKEVWFLCRQYDAPTALAWGLVNAVVPLQDLEAETVRWCREMLAESPLALRLLKAGANAGTDGLAGIQQLAGDATLLYYMTEEAQEGRDAFKEKRAPDFLAVPEAAVSHALTTWWRGARPRTLGAGIVPVFLGTAAAGHVIWWRFGAALIVAVGLQVGVNFANDYFDGVRGVDTHERMGPPRLTQSGAATPRAVLTAALVSLSAAAIAGLALALATQPALILIVGAFALSAALLYSGGPRPYAGLGLGEVMVYVFFGLMATCGSAYVMVETIPAAAWWGGAVMGFFAVAILVANNLRDIPTDGASGKRTLEVRLGEARSRTFYRACVVAGFSTIAVGVLVFMATEPRGLTQWALFGLLAWVPAIRPMEVVGKATGRDLIPVLTGTAATHAACGLLMTIGLVLWHLQKVVPVHVVRG